MLSHISGSLARKGGRLNYIESKVDVLNLYMKEIYAMLSNIIAVQNELRLQFYKKSCVSPKEQREQIFIYLSIYLFSDFVQSTRYIKQKDTSPLQGFST